LANIKKVQTAARGTPAATQKREVQQLIERGQQIEDVATVSRAAFAGTLLQYGTNPVGGTPAFTPAAATVQQFGSAVNSRAQLAQNTAHAQTAMTALRDAGTALATPAVPDTAVVTRALQTAVDTLALRGDAWTANGTKGARAATAAIDVQIDDLLAQLKVEPTEDREREGKFNLYAAFMETVSNTRDAMLRLHNDIPSETVKNALKDDIKKIDSNANLQTHREGGGKEWFVYWMAVQAIKNQKFMIEVQRKINSKLEMLRGPQDCPICLTALPANGGDVEVMGCAHRVCSQCWTHWVETCEAKHKNPFCPLCKQDEFLADVMG